MHYTCRYIPVDHLDSSFSKYWENEPDDPLVFSKRGHLFGFVTTETSQTDKNLTELIGNIISKINQTYYTLNDLDFSTQLNNCLNDIISSQTSNSQISLVLVAVKNETMSVVFSGDARLFIKRSNQFTQINPVDNNPITGPLQDQDVLFLTHQAVIDSLGDLSSLFSLTTLDAQEEYLNQKKSSLPFSLALIQAHYDSSDQENVLPLTNQQSTSFPELKPKTNRTNQISQFFKKIFKPKPIQLNQAPQKYVQVQRKRNLVIGIIALLGLLASLTIGYIKNHQKQQQQTFIRLESEILDNLKNIDTVKKLNLEDAKTLASQTSSLIDQMSLLGLYPDKISSYRSQIDQILSQTGSSEHTNPDFYYDTSLITSDPSFQKLIFDTDTLYLLDTSQGLISSVTGKSSRQISADQMSKDTKTITIFNSSPYALTNNGFYLVSKENWQKRLDLESLNPVSAYTWASGVYFLLEDTITKSSLVNNVLSDPKPWLTDDQSLPANPVDLAIDGRVWVLSKTADISVYLRGKKDNFKLTDPPQTNQASNLLLGQDEDLLIFISDPNTVLVYTKDGQPLAKYSFAQFTVLSMALNESTKTLYILASDQKIYTVTLPN